MKDHGRPYYIPWGSEQQHADKLRLGLERLGPQFFAQICGICHGRGHYRQTYTAGCGMGTYQFTGDCDYCNSSGLRQGLDPAPRSVINQVLVAAERS